MAAVDTFQNFLTFLSQEDKEKLKDFIQNQQQEMLVSRSEDARMRIAHAFIHEVRELTRKR